MRSVVAGCVLAALGVAAMIAGILPVSDVVRLWTAVWPVLLFVAAITVVADLAAEAGVFAGLASLAARLGRNRGSVLWLLVVVLATVSTVFLSLDTTALLLTPAVIVLARRVGMNPVPFAITTVWLANTASLLLPVSNLTNLLAARSAHLGPIAFAAVMWAPAITAIVVPVAAVFLMYRRELTIAYHRPDAYPAPDPVLFRVGALVVAALLPALATVTAVWIPAVAAAGILLVVFGIRRRQTASLRLVPWNLLVLAAGLFLAMDAAHAAGLGLLLARVAGHGTDALSLLRLSALGAAGANLVNNLPAYLALHPVAGSLVRLAALLVGVNTGPLITGWASLATLLWRRQVAASGVTVSRGRMAAAGAVVATLTVVAATVTLAAASG